MTECRSFHKPAEAPLRALLDREYGTAAGTVLRLAWQAGLQRKEISALTWAGVYLSEGTLQISERAIPLSGELKRYLEDLRDCQGRVRAGGRVLLSDSRRKPLAVYSVSNLARTALQTEGLEGVTLGDLRTDYTLRQIGSGGLEHAARVTGMNIHWLMRLAAEENLPAEKMRPVKASPISDRPAIDRAALEELARREGGTDGVLAVFLALDAGADLREIAELRWSSVDLPAGTLTLPSGTIRLSPILLDLLAARRRSPKARVLTAPRTGKAYPAERISRLARTALVRAGMDRLSLKDLNRAYARRDAGERLTAWIRQNGPIKRSAAAKLLNLPDQTAGHMLRILCEDGVLMPVGMKYYLPGAAVPPEEQRARVLHLLEKERSASCAAFAVELGTDVRQCGTLLRRMVQDGDIVQVGRKYQLPDKL